jgi:hypothetical protein
MWVCVVTPSDLKAGEGPAFAAKSVAKNVLSETRRQIHITSQFIRLLLPTNEV